MLLGRPNLGQILVGNGLITDEQLDTALLYQVRHNRRLGQALIELNFCTESQIAQSLAYQLEIPFIDLKQTPPLPSCIALIPREVALEYEVLPVRIENNRLVVVARDPFDIRVDEALQRAAGMPVALGLAPESQLQQQLQQCYGENSFEETATPAQEEPTDLDEDGQLLTMEKLARVGEQSSTTRVVNALIADAVRRGASDLHIEPEETRVRVRYRLDGRLRCVVTLQRALLGSMLGRVKVMCGMDISESQKPQDGVCRVRVNGRAVELRASTLRGVHGEKVVLRIQTQDDGLYRLDALGLE